VIYLIALLGLLSGWEEIQQLIQRGSWKREDYRYPEWQIDYRSRWKNFDSHHVAFGLFVLVMFLTMCVGSLTWYLTPLYWIGFFYVRNIALHIIFKKKPLWKYLIPLL